MVHCVAGYETCTIGRLFLVIMLSITVSWTLGHLSGGMAVAYSRGIGLFVTVLIFPSAPLHDAHICLRMLRSDCLAFFSFWEEYNSLAGMIASLVNNEQTLTVVSLRAMHCTIFVHLGSCDLRLRSTHTLLMCGITDTDKSKRILNNDFNNRTMNRWLRFTVSSDIFPVSLFSHQVVKLKEIKSQRSLKVQTNDWFCSRRVVTTTRKKNTSCA